MRLRVAAMASISEAERRVIRGRQIVARQQELVAKFNGQVPLAVAILRNFERTLAIFEEGLAAVQRQEVLTEQVGSSRVVDATINESNDNDRNAVDLVMEILRANGYHCELARETLH